MGVLTGQGLIAYSIIRIPGNGEDNLGRDIGLPQEELGKVAHLQATVVHPLFRGNGLQRKMAKAHLQVIERSWIATCLLHSISKESGEPGKHLLQWFCDKGSWAKVPGWCRYIMYKNILHNRNLDRSKVCEEIKIIDSDVKGQADLLKTGFVGFKMDRRPEGFRISYAKP